MANDYPGDGPGTCGLTCEYRRFLVPVTGVSPSSGGYRREVRRGRYGDLVGEAAGVHGTGWEFAWLDGRALGSEPSWSYPDLARLQLRGATSLLDLGTGTGERVA